MWQKNTNPFQQKPISKGIIESAILQSKSMTSASSIVGCSYNTFKKYAKMYGLFKPNQSGKGIGKSKMFKNVDVDVDGIKNIFGYE